MTARILATGGRRIEFAEGLAYRAGEVVVRGASAEGRLRELVPDVDTRGREVDLELVGRLSEEEKGQLERILADVRDDRGRMSAEGGWVRASGVGRAPALVQQLRAEGHQAQLNHVFFSHPFTGNPFTGNPFTGNPFTGNPFTGNPFTGNPFTGNPFTGNPFTGNPFTGNPFTGNPFTGNPARTSSAAPVLSHEPPRRVPGPGAPVRIAVLDTGVASGSALFTDTTLWASATAPDVDGDVDQPDAAIVRADGAVIAADNYLDPAAGHGTFIAGLIEQYAPGCCVRVLRLVSNTGDVDEFAVADRIDQLATGADPAFPTPPDIICMSFGGPADDPNRLQAAVARARAAGIVLVASAGNEGSPVPQFPAAASGVLSVAALAPNGPAWFSNYGDWIDACAPGQDLVSSFFAKFDGEFPTVNASDPDSFAHWARWSGTSFAAPLVVAALARDMMCEAATSASGSAAERAVERVVLAPHLLRLPMMGTVVNA